MSLMCNRHPDREADPVVCALCAGRLRRDLRDLLTLWPNLRDMLTSRGNGGTARGKRTPAPVRLDVLDLLDERGATQSVLVSWARLVVEERRLSGLPDSIGGCLTLLWRHDDWLLAHPAADEACAEIHDCAHAVRLVCGEAPEPPLGKCPELVDGHDCGGPLRIQPDGDVVCSRCGARWGSEDLPRILSVVQPTRRIPVEREWVCARYGVSPGQLRTWLWRKQVRAYGDRSVDLLDVLTRVRDTP